MKMQMAGGRKVDRRLKMQVCVTPEERDRFRLLAGHYGLTFSEFARQLLERAYAQTPSMQASGKNHALDRDRP